MKRIIAIVLVVLSLFNFGCKTEVTNNTEQEYNYLVAETGEINIPLTPFDSLDPLTTENMSYFYLSNLVFEGLFTFDENLRPKTNLAVNYDLKDNKMIVRIKDGITFHDGSRLTARDVKFSLDHIRNSAKGAYYNLIVNNITKEFVLSADVIDDTTIAFNYNGNGPFLFEYLIFPIVKYGSVNQKKPIGSGPYMIDTYEEKQELILKAFDNYHDETPSIARIKGVVHDDKDLIYTSLETGRIQVSTAWNQSFNRFFNNEYFQAKKYPSSELYFLFINPNKTIENKNHRLAIKRALDKERIIKVALDDQGVKTTSFMNPNSYFYRLDQDVRNIEKSLDLMDGEKLNVDLYLYWKNQTQVKIATMIAESLNEIGIKVSLIGDQNEDFETYNNNLKEGNYDIALASMSVNIIPDYSITLNSGLFPYSSEQLKNLNDQMNAAKDDQELIVITNKIDEQINYENVFIPLVYKMDALIYSNAIVGDINPNLIFPYKTLKSAYFTSKEKDENDKPKIQEGTEK